MAKLGMLTDGNLLDQRTGRGVDSGIPFELRPPRRSRPPGTCSHGPAHVEVEPPGVAIAITSPALRTLSCA
jgi:hypothetical protein